MSSWVCIGYHKKHCNCLCLHSPVIMTEGDKYFQTSSMGISSVPQKLVIVYRATRLTKIRYLFLKGRDCLEKRFYNVVRHPYLVVALTYIDDIIAYRDGLHFCCEEVYPNRNR